MPQPHRRSDREPVAELSRRKRQIMDAVYALGSADVQEVCGHLAPDLTYSAARSTLNALVTDGLLLRSRNSRRIVYAPAHPRESAAMGAARRMISTFFGGSVSQAVAGMLGAMQGNVSKEELDALAKVVRAARQKENA